jgi:hypothetical protein
MTFILYVCIISSHYSQNTPIDTGFLASWSSCSLCLHYLPNHAPYHGRWIVLELSLAHLKSKTQLKDDSIIAHDKVHGLASIETKKISKISCGFTHMLPIYWSYGVDACIKLTPKNCRLTSQVKWHACSKMKLTEMGRSPCVNLLYHRTKPKSLLRMI